MAIRLDRATINVGLEEAREREAEHREAVALAGNRQKELSRRDPYVARDKVMADTYGAIATGQQVVNVRSVIRDGGEDGKHRPRLAYARADRTEIYLWRDVDGEVRYQTGRPIESVGFPFSSDVITRDTQIDLTLPPGTFGRTKTRVIAAAIVPLIPPRIRPDMPDNFAILWEALWRDEQPRVLDPILLRPFGNGLAAVVAHWDLTELEAAILG